MKKPILIAAAFITFASMLMAVSLYGMDAEAPVTAPPRSADSAGAADTIPETHWPSIEFGIGLLNFSTSYNLSEEKNNFNYSIGQELMFLQDFGKNNVYYYYGINYGWGGNGRNLSLHGIIAPLEYSWEPTSDWALMNHINIGAGTNAAYNFSNKHFSVGPQLDLFGGLEQVLRINATYRYNINFGAKNSHEIGLRVSLMDYFVWGCPPKPFPRERDCPKFVCKSVEDTTSVNLHDMVFVEGGTFTMGCTEEHQDSCKYTGATPTRTVTVGGFHIGRYEVTQWLWKSVMGSNPSHYHRNNNLPVTDVSWNNVQTFIRKLNEVTGKQYRLPTEAEWEYAARGGNKSKGYRYSGSDSLGEVAITDSYCEGLCIGARAPNELGIYDMSGNVAEWVNDTYEKYGRAFRGGSVPYHGGGSRVYSRSSFEPDKSDRYLGFRLAHNAVNIGNNDNGNDEITSLQKEDNDSSGEITSSLPEDNDSNDEISSSQEKNTVSQEDVSRCFHIERPADSSKKQYTPPPDVSSDPHSIAMVFVEAGTLMTGRASEDIPCDEEKICGDDKKAQENITVDGFYISKYEVTQGLWKSVMQRNPSKNTGNDNLPVENVSWKDAQKFIRKLNAKTKKKYRLPANAEWEYAARGGNKSKGYDFSGSNFIDGVAWYVENSDIKTHPVGTKLPNELGIHDMTGNVSEWADDYIFAGKGRSKRYRNLRGGNYYNPVAGCRVAYTTGITYKDVRSGTFGFRLALTK